MISPIVPILSQLNPVYVLPLHLFKIRCHVILPSKLGFTDCPFPSCFSCKTPYKRIYYYYRCNMSCIFISLYLIALIIRDGNVNHEIPPSSLYSGKHLDFFLRYSPNRVFFEVPTSRKKIHTHTHTVGLFWKSDQLFAKPLPRKETTNTSDGTSLPSAGLQPAIPAIEGLQSHERGLASTHILP
jgi:hypothetical protein